MPQVRSVRTVVRSSRLLRIIAPWTAILLVTGAFHFYRGAPVDAVVYLAVAAALIVDALGWLRGAPSFRLPPTAATIGVSVVLGALLVISPRHGVVDGVVVTGIGLTVLPLAWSGVPRGTGRRGRTDETAIRRTALAWALLGVGGCLWEVASFLLGLPGPAAEYAHPALSDLLDPFIEWAPGRILFVAAWLAGGIALLSRGRRSEPGDVPLAPTTDGSGSRTDALPAADGAGRSDRALRERER